MEKAEALERGDLMHKMLEPYYTLKLEVANFDSDTWKELISVGIQPSNPLKTAVEAGYYFATKMNLPIEVCEETIYQMKEYDEYYRHDSWNPLAVEDVGSRVIYEDEDIRIVYNFKIDLIAEKGNIVAPFDHKTTSMNKAPSSMSNQFIGYCWALNTNTMIVNKIGFQKTLSPAQRFQRHVLTIDDDRIIEWIDNSIWWLLKLADHMHNNHWPMNLTSCDKYGACIYRQVCESNPLSRERKLDQYFIKGETWDVSKRLA
jgi:hypothetical protein